jgi:hypothetical protein
VTFEIKTEDNINAISVFESLAHTRTANYSYVFVVLHSLSIDNTPQHSRITEECGRHGIGLMSASSWNNKPFLVQHFPASRRTPDLALTNDFLNNVLTNESKIKFAGWR